MFCNNEETSQVYSSRSITKLTPVWRSFSVLIFCTVFLFSPLSAQEADNEQEESQQITAQQTEPEAAAQDATPVELSAEDDSAAEEPVPEPTVTQPLAVEVATRFDQLVAEIATDEREIQRLIARRDESEGVFAAIFSARIDRTGTEMFASVLTLGREIVAQRNKGFDIAGYEAAVVEDLGRLPQEIYGAVDRLREQIEFPTGEQEPQDFVYKDQILFAQLTEADAIYKVLIDYVAIAGEFGIDASAEEEYLRNSLIESSANRSIFLEIAVRDVSALRSSVGTLPNNAALAEWYAAAQARVNTTAQSMQRLVNLMNSVDIDTSAYRKQILGVTGGISTDVLDVGIAASLAKEWSGALLELIAEEGPKWIFRLLIFVLVIFGFIQLSKLVQKMVKHGLNSARVRVSYLLKEMIISSARNLVILFGILVALSQLGISLGPLLAGLGIAGFIIGFALQDSLSNFASGMLILLYRPFDVGDVVDSGGVRGRVSAMSLVNTTFLTLDNQKLVVPNNLIWQSVITNVTAQRKRRIDMLFGIAYSDDVEKAQRILEQILDEDETVLDDPEPMVRVHELGESSVNFAVRPWVRTSDYWETYWEITKKVKLRFDKEGISIPFPQRDVHLFEHKADSE